MARKLNRLTARTVQTLSKPGRHSDGGGLYLSVTKAGNKKWIYLYRRRSDRKLVEMGLGSFATVSLAMAREEAAAQRTLLHVGKDPLTERRVQQIGEIPTFKEFAEEYITHKQHAWRDPKHRQQWSRTLEVYAGPINDLPLDKISTEDILAVLQPIWLRVPETASRIRGRIEKILDAAKVRQFRAGENPARWRGHLDAILPKRRKLQRGHHPAMPWQSVPEFVSRLHAVEALSAKCLEYVLLTCARTGEVLHSFRDGKARAMMWHEVDFENCVWTVPADRMKSGIEHRKPLSGRALEVLEQVRPLRQNEFVFPSMRKRGEAMSPFALEGLLRRMGDKPYTVHGFRSSFRDWAGDAGFPWDVAEAALAHRVGDATERAYRRSDDLERRREMMEAWSRYCSGDSGHVIQLPRHRATAGL